MPSWIFKKQQPGDTTREPISGEFFATEAIRDSAEALIREGIQNSLDARSANQVVEIRIRLASGALALEPEQISPFVASLWPHLEARGNGLNDPPVRPDSCSFLVFEDFGTRGLEGDPHQWHPIDNAKNSFFAFFRAEGRSEKDSSSLGKWGVGKFVFPRASRASTFFGLTIPETTGRPLLMGRCILKSHNASGARCVPDGYFGETQRIDGSELAVPVDEPKIIERFRHTFGLRRAAEPGLSLVVPWYDQSITPTELIEATIADWFFSILAGDLVVVVEDGNGTTRLDADSLAKVVVGLSGSTRERLAPLIELAQFARSEQGRMPVLIGAPDTVNSPKWHDAMMGDELAAELAQRLEREEPLAVRIPLRVKPRKAPDQDSWFDVFLRRDMSAGETRPVFARNGIIISDAKGRVLRGFRAIVSITDRPLADLLGDAENPSHTEWRPDSANFKERYRYGPGYLSFVKGSVAELVRLLQAAEADEAPDLLVDLFSLPSDPEPERPARPRPQGGSQPGPTSNPPAPPPPPKPARYRIQRLQGGFGITRGSADAPPPSELLVSVAYDVRRGDPFSKYDPADFVLLKGGIQLAEKPRGLAVIEQAGNRLRLAVTDPDFRLSMTGFDENRDLIVRVTAKDGDSVDKATELDA